MTPHAPVGGAVGAVRSHAPVPRLRRNQPILSFPFAPHSIVPTRSLGRRSACHGFQSEFQSRTVDRPPASVGGRVGEERGHAHRFAQFVPVFVDQCEERLDLVPGRSLAYLVGIPVPTDVTQFFEPRQVVVPEFRLPNRRIGGVDKYVERVAIVVQRKGVSSERYADAISRQESAQSRSLSAQTWQCSCSNCSHSSAHSSHASAQISARSLL